MPGLAGHVLESPRLPGEPPAVRRAPAVEAERAARAVCRQRPRARRRHARLPPLPVRPGPPRRGDARASPSWPTTRTTCCGARATSRCWQRRRRSARRSPPSLPQRSGAVPALERPAAAGAAGGRRAAAPGTRASPHSPRDCPRTRSSSRRRRLPGPRCSTASRRARRSATWRSPTARSASASPASIGLRMALPDRPVLALLGDGSSTYSIQALWSAARYGAGVVFVILGNGRYAVMDELASAHGAPGAWPGFEALDLATVAAGMGCPSRTHRHARRAAGGARRGAAHAAHALRAAAARRPPRLSHDVLSHRPRARRDALDSQPPCRYRRGGVRR